MVEQRLNWPKDSYGRLICDENNPMPRERDQMGQRWVHMRAVEEDSSSDYHAVYRCPCCGHRWTEELPE